MLLNGASPGTRGAFCREVGKAAADEAGRRGWNLEAFDLEAMTIKPCQGCFGCWMKHPGLCAIRDGQEDVLKAMAASDIQVWTTPVTFGGYSAALKKSLDRAIPNILPFFIKIDGEIHHPQRYEKRRAILLLGTLPAPETESERIFHELARRNALNLGNAAVHSRIFYERGASANISAGVKSSLDFLEKSL